VGVALIHADGRTVLTNLIRVFRDCAKMPNKCHKNQRKQKCPYKGGTEFSMNIPS
jgi:hypothetical protein